ncbi:cytochrome c biogenesis protein [Leminorella grimontii]|uniref:Formate-dependent nitrite reductase complex subunit n=1 Tax=Leminorella grimontii TaxID=82981 RepID=A0AAV5N667_9GAMM|nr:heme lyase NrfEFG subunit NrfF [Leminorella grimontii]KFC94254.1 NrfF family cytochrome c-type heme lyase subunit [Leminorella grimontii ATCC 33999 = DSM 5078]GKX57591.1 cytochrome c biogenesis protein [Leminorella grimontii]GKX60024.1 cytochrome c biogenesis protein [Leminorella grimontii]VFS54686.1 Cytochrome c-type biogenesis protein CcmH precursor [Leminorella grimontii]
MIRCWRLLLLLCFALPLRAEIVDTWQFKTPENQERAVTLAKQLRCPQCQNQNLVESTSPIARDLRLEVYRMVDEGKSNDEIVSVMTSRFGDFVLYKPRFGVQTALLWLSPLVLLLFAAVAAWRYVRRRAQPLPEMSDEQRRKLEQLLEKKR